MRSNRTIAAAIAIAALGLGLAACGNSASPDASPTSSQTTTASHAMMRQGTTRTGAFAGLNGKSVAGTVTIEGGMVTLARFSSDEGPDLHLYLANGTDEAAVSSGEQLGAVAADKASQTFAVRGGDASKYTDVVVHCDKAKAVFGSAPLS